jgi:DNA helicase HerA-like ATPase
MLAKQLLILNLKPLQPSQNVLRQVMAIAVSQYFDAMLTLSPARFRDDANGVQLRDLQSVLLIDEANVVMRQNLMKLDDTLLQGREFGVSVIISSQFPNHFFDNDVEYASKLRTWFMHRVPILSSADLRRLGIARNVERLSQRVLELQPFHSLFASGFEAPRIIRDQPLHEILPADG